MARRLMVLIVTIQCENLHLGNVEETAAREANEQWRYRNMHPSTVDLFFDL